MIFLWYGCAGEFASVLLFDVMFLSFIDLQFLRYLKLQNTRFKFCIFDMYFKGVREEERGGNFNYHNKEGGEEGRRCFLVLFKKAGKKKKLFSIYMLNNFLIGRFPSLPIFCLHALLKTQNSFSNQTGHIFLCRAIFEHNTKLSFVSPSCCFLFSSCLIYLVTTLCGELYLRIHYEYRIDLFLKRAILLFPIIYLYYML